MEQHETQEPYTVPSKEGHGVPAAWKLDYYYEQPYTQTLPYYPTQGLRVRQHTSPAYVQPQQHTMSPQPPPPSMQTNHSAAHYYYQQQQQQQQQPTHTMPYPMSSGRTASLGMDYLDTGMASRPTRKRRRPPHSYATLIAQAILTSPEQRLTLREIYEWIQTRYPHLYEANETGWQNTIRHNLSLNRCFMKLPRDPQEGGKIKGSKGGFWAVDIEKLNHTNFGRQIIDSGFMASTEYWQQQQMLEEQNHHQRQRQTVPAVSAPHSGGFQLHRVQQQPVMGSAMEEFDFDNLVAPPFEQAGQVTHRSAVPKTSSIRESVSPGSTASSSMNTPMLSSQSNTQSLKFELPAVVHH